MLVESVPNYSEGRRLDVVDRLAAAVEATAGAFLLDRTSDPSHNRSVLTLAGEAGAVEAALEATIGVAIDEVDMERHTGEHPRIGAVDVIPFVPLDGTPMDACVRLARDFGARVAERFGLPVYLYARAAARPDRVKLADVRRGGYEGLRDALRAGDPGRAPDFGPARIHPRAGAVAIGARPFLIAWNVNLETADVEVAKRIARTVRESGGGLAAVQGNGFMIDELGVAQVSMNLLDFTTTPLWRVWEEIGRLAATEGVDVRESELIGLVPRAALDAVATRAGASPDAPPEQRFATAAGYLALRDPDPMMVLEGRLEAARAGG